VKELSLQLLRLERHHLAARATYDEISLRELAHALRVWCDISESGLLERVASAERKVFRTQSPDSKFFRKLPGRTAVLSMLVEGVATFANGGHIAGLKKDQNLDPCVYVRFRQLSPSGLVFKQYLYTSPAHDVPIAELFNRTFLQRKKFSDWLQSPAVYLRGNFATEHGISAVSVQSLIERVANEYGASHPAGAIAERHLDKANSAAVKWLFEHRVAGLPLPYLLLLSFAERILSCFQDELAGARG
jgi:hypothetical protein